MSSSDCDVVDAGLAERGRDAVERVGRLDGGR